MESLDTVVIGAGVIGLAVARALARAGREVVVLEAAETFGTETSSRNSEVIHAGIYYPPGSLKARLCVAGKHALYAYCRERGIPHANCGKLIVATDPAQVERLHAIAARARANGVPDLVAVDGAGVRARAPAIAAVAGLWSPSTGILDSHAFMLALLGDLEAAGGVLVTGSPVAGGAVTDDGIELTVGGRDPCRVRARRVVNAGGLAAQAVAGSLDGFPASALPRRHLAKGTYFTLSGRAPVDCLVYPVPEPGGLGVHLTLDLGGQARFGPDVEWVDRVDYAVDAGRAARFEAAIRGWWPDLPDGALQPGYAGIRPKLVGPGEPDADFLVQGQDRHGVAGLVNLFGIESPGLTASLALADHVAGLLTGSAGGGTGALQTGL